MIDVNKRLVEVNEVLLQLSEKDINKIPEEFILNIRNKMDKNYFWKYDQNKQVSEQGLSKDTIAILSYINLEYLLNEEQKNLMKQIYENNQIRIDNELYEKYKQDNLFKNKYEKQTVGSAEKIIENSTNTALIDYKESIFTKFKNFIFKILHINQYN